eukprot:457908_1
MASQIRPYHWRFAYRIKWNVMCNYCDERLCANNYKHKYKKIRDHIIEFHEEELEYDIDNETGYAINAPVTGGRIIEVKNDFNVYQLTQKLYCKILLTTFRGNSELETTWIREIFYGGSPELLHKLALSSHDNIQNRIKQIEINIDNEELTQQIYVSQSSSNESLTQKLSHSTSSESSELLSNENITSKLYTVPGIYF